jgi:transposase
MALGLHRQTVSNLMREYRGVGDTRAIADLLVSLRPDLVFDVKRLDGHRKKLHRSIKRRFELSHHPLMRHPLASTAPPEARLDDAQMDAVMAALKPGTYWTSRPAQFRRLLDALLIQLRTGCNFSDLPVDIGEIGYTRRQYNFLHDEPLRLATRALLEHAGIIETGERLIFKAIPAYTSKHVEQDGWTSMKKAKAARAKQR